jgi:hypothetical protein
MADHASITGAPSRAPAFPSLRPLGDVSAMLHALHGGVDVLSEALENREHCGNDLPLAAHAIGYLVKAVKTKLDAAHQELIDYRFALHTEER